MSTYLFPEFESNRADYERLVSFWQTDIWGKASPRARHRWIAPWFSARPIELQDGNPIFTAWAPDQRTGLTVIQVPPKTAARDLDHRISWFGGPPSDADAIRTLTIICALTDRNAGVIINWIGQWVTTGRIVERKRQIQLADASGFMLPATYAVSESIGGGVHG